jgi:Sigma-70, region 4
MFPLTLMVRGTMPRRKQAKRTTVKDIRSILRLTHEHGLSVRGISERLQISKTSVATYLLRAREAGLSWPLPAIYESDASLEQALFRRVGRPPLDLSEPNWPLVAQELKRKGVTLTLLWQEYRAAHLTVTATLGFASATTLIGVGRAPRFATATKRAR